MKGSPPSRRPRFRKRGADSEGTSPGVYEDERGRPASLEAAAPDEGGERLPEQDPEPTAAPPARRGAAVRASIAKSGSLAKLGIALVADRIIDLAPRVPVRDLATLRRQFPGLGPEELADKLVAGAARATSAVGAGVGAAAMLPVPPAMPTELATEVTGVAVIELKLIAELHEVYGLRPPGGLGARSTAYLGSWSQERGIYALKLSSFDVALGGQMKRELRQQIMKRTLRNLPSLTPFMVGATVGAVMNRRDTRRLAGHIRADLRRRQVPWQALADQPALPAPEDVLQPGELPADLRGQLPEA
ncbi:hypothetical protein [Streptomyces sp. NPDC058045]|uniref:hypothetical protein n=1 Tax=Streptomyces sp. NPDC058045 TaxID=3346311 RepID=UPI0036E5FEDF